VIIFIIINTYDNVIIIIINVALYTMR